MRSLDDTRPPASSAGAGTFVGPSPLVRERGTRFVVTTGAILRGVVTACWALLLAWLVFVLVDFELMMQKSDTVMQQCASASIACFRAILGYCVARAVHALCRRGDAMD